LIFTEDTAYEPSSGSNATEAAFTLPFTLPVDIISLEGDFIVTADGVSVAELQIPMSPASTDVDTRIIHLTFSDVPFAAFGDKHDAFNQFVAAVTTTATENMHLSGSTNVNAKTGVGVLPLTDIAFSVDTSIAGLQGLNSKPTTVGSLDVAHGFPDFLLITTTASLFNPRYVLTPHKHEARTQPSSAISPSASRGMTLDTIFPDPHFCRYGRCGLQLGLPVSTLAHLLCGVILTKRGARNEQIGTALIVSVKSYFLHTNSNMVYRTI
jgi:hypothetical protein